MRWRLWSVTKKAYSQMANYKNFWKFTDNLIIYVSPTFQITAINPAAEQILAWLKCIISKIDFELSWQDIAEHIRQWEKATITNEHEVMTEQFFTLTNDKKRNFLLKNTPLKNDQGILVGVLAILIDITDREKNENILGKIKENFEEGNRTKLEFLSNIAHDFKTPINNLFDKTLFMRDKISNPDLLKALSDIENMGHLMNRLVNDIQSFAKFDLMSDNETFTHEIDSLEISDNRLSLIDEFPQLQLICINKGLSKRESECIYHLIRGMTAKQIGKTMGLSNRTVEFYLDNAKTKLNCTNKFELISRIFDEKIL